MILQYPHEKLKTPTTDFPSKEIVKMLLPHFKVLVKQVEDKALGLAAPQTGLSYSLVWIKDFGYMINPKIISSSEDVIHSYESCLSIPYKTFTVERKKKITVLYKDENFKLKKKVFRDRWAIIVQHEIDHCHGLTLQETGIEVILAAGQPAEA